MRAKLLLGIACSVALLPIAIASPAAAQSAQSTTTASPPETARPSLYEPSLSPDAGMIVFVSGGDIWEVPASGGVAHLLVTGAATEGRPLYSPDGKRLAFTSTRGGSANIFVLDLASGAISRITYAEANEELDAWSVDGQFLYFASAANDVGRVPDIFRVSAAGGTPVEVSRERYLSEFQAAPSPDGSAIVLAARGISNAQWWRNGHSHIDETELWLKPLAEGAPYRKLVADGAKHAWPMWTPDGAAILYMSDSSGTENLWRLALAPGAAPQPLTRFADGRLLYPAMAANGSAIVFERDFGNWRYDLRSGQAAPVPIALRGAPAREERRHVTLSSFARMSVSPDGQKLAVIAHGELFAVPAKDGGQAQRLTISKGAERELVWSPDSRRIAYVTERGLAHVIAEMEVATGKETLLTSRGVASVPAYSPDGKSIAYVMDNKELRVIGLAQPGRLASDRLLFTGAVATDERDGPRPTWSPDGAWIAFPLTDRRSFTNVSVIPAAGGPARPVSFLANGQMGGIAWSPDGKYILLDTAQRSEDSRIVRVDLLPHVPKYREDTFRDLFKTEKSPGTPAAPADSQAKTDSPAPLPSPKGKGKDAVAAPPPAKPAPVAIVWEGLRERATLLPLGLSADSPAITADGKTLVFRASERGQTNLYSYNLDELATEPPVAQQISQSARAKGDFALTADGKTLFYLDGGSVISTPLETPRPKAIAIAAAMDVDFAAEKQIVFDQAWGALDRRFFDPAFNGKDWKALRARFQPYVDGAQTSDELRRNINLMIGELNASHSGINRPARGDGALPTDRVGRIGLHFDRAAYESGRGLVVRQVIDLGPASIAKVRAGDRLVSIDGRAIGPNDNLDALLENKVGRRVSLVVETASGRRDVVVQPVSAAVESGLHYRQWVAGRRAMVEKLSGGRLGYVHIPDMSSDSLNQLYLDLDAENQGRQGVVIDIRNNNGGFINGYALDVFSRRNFLTMTPRDLFAVPSRQALGQRALGLPTVLLTNESSLSDAEDFTEGYRALGLGKVVGQPTSGWIIYTGPEPLIDGSTVRVPSTRIQDAAGRDLEMNPRPVDVAVERPLGESLSGGDAQLEAAVRLLLDQLGGKQGSPPSRP
jgi:Tol biopolymer transport system component/C-terminal processing protease CtpA/Prc